MLYVILVLMGTLLFLLGACFFSFLNVVVWRTPRGESLVHGRSHCPSCGRVLTAWELVPCFSFLALRGKCYGCGAKIPTRDFWVEALGGGLFLGCNLRFGLMSGQAMLVFALLFILTVVALMDWDTGKIYDRFPAMILGCAVIALLLVPENGIPDRLAGCVLVGIPALLLKKLLCHRVSRGETELTLALGAFLGWKHMLLAAVFAAAGCGAYVLVRKIEKDRLSCSAFLCAGAGLALFLR